MSEFQHAVFQFDVKTLVMVGDSPRIFESLADAERYCRESIAANPALGYRILDHEGKTAGTVADDQLYAKHHGQPAAKRNLWVGAALLAAGAASVGLDAWLGWRLVFGVLLGIRFLWAGCVKTIEGVTSLRRERLTTRNQELETRN